MKYAPLRVNIHSSPSCEDRLGFTLGFECGENGRHGAPHVLTQQQNVLLLARRETSEASPFQDNNLILR